MTFVMLMVLIYIRLREECSQKLYFTFCLGTSSARENGFQSVDSTDTERSVKVLKVCLVLCTYHSSATKASI
jgi:hypothetical protein